MTNQTPSLSVSFAISAGFVCFLWLVKVVELAFGFDLHFLGVFPQSINHLAGIITAPIVHGSLNHLGGNSLPLILLGGFLIYGYPRSWWRAVVIIWLCSGLGVWLLARESFHFGASGLTHGLFFYLFFGGILRRDRRSAVLLMIAFYMYGGMLMTIFPREVGISYEYHFAGALAGAVSAWLFRLWDPKLPDQQYAWQNDSQQDGRLDDPLSVDPVIGDEWRLDYQPPQVATEDDADASDDSQTEPQLDQDLEPSNPSDQPPKDDPQRH